MRCSTTATRFSRLTLHALSISAALVLSLSSAVACPRIGNFLDYNCDGKISIVALGDSFVKGRGDLELKRNPGYMGRLALRFPNATFTKLAFPGITTHDLLAVTKEEFEKRPKKKFAKAIGTADILIIDVGRNDFFDDDAPEFTVATLKRLSAYIQSKTKTIYKSTPLTAIAFLAPTPRRFQQPVVDTINAQLLMFRSEEFPVYLRFDLLDVLTISIDGIHPAAAGHQQLADLAGEYLKEEAPKRQKVFRSDEDLDGIYDQFEKLRFKTSPKKADTDGDSLGDGDEVFTLKTNPLKIDSDEDGIPDAEEITAGTDPLTPNS